MTKNVTTLPPRDPIFALAPGLRLMEILPVARALACPAGCVGRGAHLPCGALFAAGACASLGLPSGNASDLRTSFASAARETRAA